MLMSKNLESLSTKTFLNNLRSLLSLMVELEAEDLYDEMIVAYNILSEEYGYPLNYIRATNGSAYIHVDFDSEGKPIEASLGSDLSVLPDYSQIEELYAHIKDNCTAEIAFGYRNTDYLEKTIIRAAKNSEHTIPFINIIKNPEKMLSFESADFREVMDFLGAKYSIVEGKTIAKTEQSLSDIDIADTFLDIFDIFCKKNSDRTISVKWSNYEPFKWYRPNGTEVNDIKCNFKIELTNFKKQNSLSINVTRCSIPEEESYGVVKEDVIKAINSLLNYGCDFGEDWEIYSSEDDPLFLDNE